MSRLTTSSHPSLKNASDIGNDRMLISDNEQPHALIVCPDGDIIVPFICRRCGNCCRSYDPDIEPELLPEISSSLGLSIDSLENRLRTDRIAHAAGRPTDCCFLHPQSAQCMIYPVRPLPCRQFPSLTGASVLRIDCGGYQEYQRTLAAFRDRLHYISLTRPSTTRKRKIMPAALRGTARQALSAVNASEHYCTVFERLNDD